MRWTIRLVGLASTVILARLLTPDDFGLAAMAMLVGGVLFGITEFGTTMLLIRVRDIDQAHCHTAWTITLLKGVVIGLLILLLAPVASAWFDEPRLVGVMAVLALSAAIGGLSSVGPALIRRELKFALDYRYNVYRKLVDFVATVSLAFLLRDYWALVFGTLIGTIGGVVLSYMIHPYRPAWSLARAGEYIRFSLAIVPMRGANVLHGMTAKFLVGSMGSTGAMGLFTVSHGVATLFTQEIVLPMGRGLFPNYARLASDKPRLSAVYRKVLGMVALLALPVGLGVSAVAEDLVAVLLGQKWTEAVPLVRYLAIGAALYAVVHTMYNQILVATGRERAAAVLAWLRLAITVPVLMAGLAWGGVVGLAIATIFAPLVYLPLIYLETRRAVDLSLPVLVSLFWRPVLGALLMYVTVWELHPSWLDVTLLRLLWDVAVGGVTYVATVLLLWLLAGRPQGAETMCLGLVLRAMQWRPAGARPGG